MDDTRFSRNGILVDILNCMLSLIFIFHRDHLWSHFNRPGVRSRQTRRRASSRHNRHIRHGVPVTQPVSLFRPVSLHQRERYLLRLLRFFRGVIVPGIRELHRRRASADAVADGYPRVSC